MSRKSILFASMIVLFGATASSQSSSVTGIVTDPSGAVVAGATVTLTNAGTGLQWTMLTTDKGYYSIPLLKAGTYRLAVQAAGFKVSQLPVLALEVSQTVRQDFQLEIGELTQQVNVEATAPALDKESAVRGSIFHERPVQDLPLNGRNFIKLAQLAAGA